eukprot:6455418-Amphidinium_carterae.1
MVSKHIPTGKVLPGAPDEAVDALPHCNAVALTMRRNARTSQTTKALEQLATDLDAHRKSVLRYVQATAHRCREVQERNLEALAEYVWRQSQSTLMVPIAFIYRHAYDETKLRIRVQVEQGLQHTGVGGSKIFVLLSSWSMLMRHRDS